MDNSQLTGQIIKRAWEDESFKQALMENPSSAIESTFGQALEVKPGTTLKVFDQTESNVTFLNIPPKPNFEEMELSDEQLEMVAGGEVVVSAVVISAITSAVGSATLTYMIGKDKK
ncbi:NHLP leader peptide family RiPP precursor [Pontibacter sp. G13]|uniref:NHLP leader peptide family RiPP precursor n=1 Tax=Pontibacter sp. G13 TaxID=3074898 RepID=UPI00288A6438|nr:NHLP leader peptide family RiPP precursor [Pontibacter sp. G13]WNJ16383.1 NHLP leader peptide family RiPP precursor [Pontibacter sp. G13]